MDIFEPTLELVPTTALTCAVFSNQKPAITINKYGSGYGIAYAFFPGYQYENSAYWDDLAQQESQFTRLPYGWGKIQRTIIVAPAKLANTEKSILLSHELIENCRLDSDDSVAIILLNWSDIHIEVLKLKILNFSKSLNRIILKEQLHLRIKSVRSSGPI